ncbi:MAG: VWA domain-containing protein [Acidobacteriota bacterium]
MKRFATVLALLAIAMPALPQQAFEEKIEVNAVLLDVIVTDPKGNQILGLTKDDFVVKENGVPQEIESLDYLTNRQLLDSREGNAPFQVERVHEDRYFLFFFDKPEDAGALVDQLNQARRAVQHFVRDEMKDTDRVAIVGHDVRLKVYTDFTSDKARLERAINDSARFGPGQLEASGDGPSILRGLGRKTLVDETGTVYQALDLLADSLRPIRARKNLVLFSPGIADVSETIRNGVLLDRSRYVDPMLQSLNAANVSVYPVQLQRELSGTGEPVIHQRLSELATSTGGRYFQFNTSFRPVVESVEQTNSGYYLVTYRANKPRGEKGFQKVDVSVKNKDLRVTARSGYQYGG